MITKGPNTLAQVKKALAAAYYDVHDLDENGVRVQDSFGGNYLIFSEGNGWALSITFGMRFDASDFEHEDLVEICNEINDEKLMPRASADEDSITLDHVISLDGDGVPEATFIRTLRNFMESIPPTVARFSDD